MLALCGGDVTTVGNLDLLLVATSVFATVDLTNELDGAEGEIVEGLGSLVAAIVGFGW